jgi:D-amino-acid dehydrogenase
MKIAVIGAGMAGVAAAQALASDGHDVTVVERRSSVAEETSFAPAGIAAAGLAAPWLPASGRLKTMAGNADDESRLRGTGAAFAAPTLFGKGDGQAAQRAERALALHRLLTLGVERIDELARALGLDFERGDGLLLTLSDSATAAQAEAAVAWLQAQGERAEWADAARQRQLEPGRAPSGCPTRASATPASGRSCCAPMPSTWACASCSSTRSPRSPRARGRP